MAWFTASGPVAPDHRAWPVGGVIVPTLPGIHLLFDLLAWLAGIGLGLLLYRWRLRDLAERTARVTGPGYAVSLVIGGAAGAWLSGSLNTLMQSSPTLSHSVVGALAGAVVAVESYKFPRGLVASTGGVFTRPFGLGNTPGPGYGNPAPPLRNVVMYAGAANAGFMTAMPLPLPSPVANNCPPTSPRSEPFAASLGIHFEWNVGEEDQPVPVNGMTVPTPAGGPGLGRKPLSRTRAAVPAVQRPRSGWAAAGR